MGGGHLLLVVHRNKVLAAPLSVVCLRGAAFIPGHARNGAEWRNASATATATLKRSCRGHCLRPRCRLRAATCSDAGGMKPKRRFHGVIERHAMSKLHDCTEEFAQETRSEFWGLVLGGTALMFAAWYLESVGCRLRTFLVLCVGRSMCMLCVRIKSSFTACTST